MKYYTTIAEKYKNPRVPESGQGGAALIEFAIIIPLLALLAFVAVDFGRLFHARLIVTNVCREGGSMASREFLSPTGLINMLQSSSEPINLEENGRIYITRVRAGTGIPEDERYPRIRSVHSSGELNVSSSISEHHPSFGFSPTIFEYLQYHETYDGRTANTSIISEVVVVEVYFLFRPITPLPGFLRNNMFNQDGGMIISSRAVLQYVDL